MKLLVGFAFLFYSQIEFSASTSQQLLTNSINLQQNCDDSLKKCISNYVCGLALHDYRISCKLELYGLSVNCSELCQISIISLSTITEGYNYLHCDCANNTYCKLLRERTNFCNPQVNTSTKLCRVSELYCKANSVCVEAWNYYRYLCEQALIGKQCTTRCNNSISILMRQKLGVNVKECICEKDNNFLHTCVTEQSNVNRLCYGIVLPNHYQYNDLSSHSSATPTLPTIIFQIIAYFMLTLTLTRTYLSLRSPHFIRAAF